MKIFYLSVLFVLLTTNVLAEDVSTASETNKVNSISSKEIISESESLYSQMYAESQLLSSGEGMDDLQQGQRDDQDQDDSDEDKNDQDSELVDSMNEDTTFAEVIVTREVAEQAEVAEQEQGNNDETKNEATVSQEQEAEATSTQTTTTTTTTNKPSRFSFYIESWNEGLLSRLDEGSETYWTIRPQYQLTDKLSVRYSFEVTNRWNWSGDQGAKTLQTSMGDHYLMFNHGSFSAGPFDLFGYVRIYLPTSNATRDVGQIARVRFKPYVTLPVTRNIKLAFRLETNYYQHSTDSRRRQLRSTGNDLKLRDKCYSNFCPSANTWFRIEPMLGFLGKIYGPFSFESIHGFRYFRNFTNETAQIPGEEELKASEIRWYNESGVMFDVPGTPVTLLVGFYDNRKTGGSILKRLPIVSYFTGPHDESYWVFSVWASI